MSKKPKTDEGGSSAEPKAAEPKAGEPKAGEPKTAKPKAAKKGEEQKGDEGGLIAAAKAVGKTAGKIAAIVGIKAEPTPPRPKVGKLQKKNRHRLPRREKKAQQKAAALTQA